MVDATALIKALCTYGAEKLSPEQAMELVSQLEVDANGYINFNDYVNMMMSS
jgi:Ca2+-binding EF-hand superfamily protein